MWKNPAFSLHPLLHFNMIDPAPASSSTGPPRTHLSICVLEFTLVSDGCAGQFSCAVASSHLALEIWLSHLHEKIFSIDRNKNNKKTFDYNDAGGWCRQSHDRVTSKRFDKRSTTILPRGKTKQEHRETKRGTLEWCLLAGHQIRMVSKRWFR